MNVVVFNPVMIDVVEFNPVMNVVGFNPVGMK